MARTQEQIQAAFTPKVSSSVTATPTQTNNAPNLITSSTGETALSSRPNAYIPQSGPSNIAPVVVTSESATKDLQNIQDEHKKVVDGINNQAVVLANQKAVADAQAEVEADKQAKAKAEADKLAIEKQQADTKASALKQIQTGGTSQQTTEVNPVVKERPYRGNQDWMTITRADGTSQVVSKNDDGTYTPVAQSEITLQEAKTKQAQVLDEYTAAANNVSKTILNIQNGIIPLNAGEIAQVQGLQQSFNQLIEQQKLANISATNVAQIRGFQKGAAEYDPTFQVKTIGTIVTAGINKVADLNIKMASAVAELTDKFKQNDITAIKESWNVYKEASEKRQAVLKNTIDNAQTEIKAVNDKIEKDRQYNLDVAKYQETKEQNIFDRNYKQEELKLKYSGIIDSGGNPVTRVVVPLNNGVPDPVKQQEFLDSLPPMTKTTVQSLIDYTADPKNLSGYRGAGGGPSQRQTMLALAHQADPTYDESQYAARYKFNQSWNGGGIASSNNAINTALQHLTELKDAADKLENASKNKFGPFTKKYNSIANYITDNQGKPEVKNYEYVANLVAAEIAKAYKNGLNSNAAPSEEEIKQQRIILDNSVTPEQASGVVGVAFRTLNDKVSATMDQYQSTMGRPAPNVYMPSTIQKLSELKDKGVPIGISNVPYTDKDMYIKNIPNAEQNLRDAEARLRAANLPVTPENILQAAQVNQ